MSGSCKRILSPFTGRKIRKAWSKTREKSIPEERRQNLAERDRGSCYNQEEWLQKFLDDKDAFYNGSESDDSDNNDENYNENIEGSRSKMFFKISFLKNFANFTGKHFIKNRLQH